jgi:pimeloyl-ACP methyl ester carboxylesterase
MDVIAAKADLIYAGWAGEAGGSLESCPVARGEGATLSQNLAIPTGCRYSVNGIEMHVLIAGSGPDVLLLHGFPDSHKLWRYQVPALVAAGFRVIAPDLRGYGLTEIPKGGVKAYRMDQLVADVVSLLDVLGVAKVRLVGHDWGAGIGWQAAILHPDRIDRYVAISVGHPTSFKRGGFKQKLSSWYMLMFQLRGFAEWLISVNDFELFGRLSGFPQEVPNWRADLGRPGRLTAALSYYRANIALMLFDSGNVTVPVMGIWSAGDTALTEQQMVNSARFCKAGWRYERIDGVGHWVPLEAPERLNAFLVDYLR